MVEYFCDWKSVISDILQGSVLGLLLLMIYVSSLDVNVGGIISTTYISDDTNVGVVISGQHFLRLH